MVSSGGKLVAHRVGGGAYIPNHTKFRCGDTAPNIQQSSGHQALPMRQNQKRLGKGRCNFFLAAWRGKCASAYFIKPPVWAIVRTTRLPGQTRGNLGPTFLYTFVSDALSTSKL